MGRAGRPRFAVAVVVVSSAFALPFLLLLGKGMAQAPPAPSSPAGRALYEAHCASCHGGRGEGLSELGPEIAGLGPATYDFYLSTGRMPLDRPVLQAARKAPAFGRVQIDQLIVYLQTLAPGVPGTPIPHVDPSAGTLSAGQQVYQRSCAPCHGTTAIGGAVGHVDAPSLRVATPVQIAEAVRIGPGAMPVFDAQTISDQDLSSVVRYVLYLRAPNDRGGAGLAHVGPIVEGLVGLLGGLGAIVIVTRLIGTRS